MSYLKALDKDPEEFDDPFSAIVGNPLSFAAFNDAFDTEKIAFETLPKSEIPFCLIE